MSEVLPNLFKVPMSSNGISEVNNMSEDLRARILSTHSIECRGVPTYKGLCLPEAASVLLTTRVDGTVEVACPYYKEYNENKNAPMQGGIDVGTCGASDMGNSHCTYRKINPDSEVSE